MTVPRWFLIRLMVGGAAALAPYVTIEIDGIRHAVGTGADPRATNFLVQMPVDLCKSRREREFFHAKMYALHRAAGDGDAAQVEALLDDGCGPNMLDAENRTPLHCLLYTSPSPRD